MDKIPIAKTVDEYLATLPPKVKAMLEDLRQAIKSSAPEAEEVISYRIPTYKYYGPLIHFVARDKYCSLIAVSKTMLETFKNELKPYKTSGTTIHFTVENPLSKELVRKIIQARLKENELG
jgi:uncharacterized protein YdhG (YjbR/CyaY superfamily)